MIQKKFKEEEENVLFIDETYSLLDNRDGSYGNEAINTIVQEMENHRNNVIVIFTGYPDNQAYKKLEQLFSFARKHENFGNRRYVYNVIEKAQAVRLLNQGCNRITANDLITLYMSKILKCQK